MKSKKLMALLLASAMTASLAACGNSNNKTQSSGGDENSASGNDGEIVLTIPTFYVGENVGAVYFEPAVERFNEQNKGKYRIELEEVVEASYTDKISQLAQAGELPALVSTPSIEWIETVLIPNNLYYPVNDFLDEHPEIKELCLESSIEYCTQENGDIVSIPIVTLSNMGSYYNSALYSPDKNIVDMTVDEFLDSLGDNKLAFQTVDNAWTSMLFYTALVANEEGGAELLQKYDGEKLHDFNQEQFINAAVKLQEIWKTYAAGNSVGAAYADAANGFMSNQSAVIFNGSWMNSEFDTSASGNWSNDFDGANVKADYYPGNVAICNTKGYGRWTLTNGGTESEQECARAFMAFIYSQEELEKFAITEGCQIPNMEYSEDFLSQLDAQPLVKAQTELVTENTTIVPSVASIMVDSIANEVFANDLVQLATGAITPEQFCEDLTIKSQEAANN